MLSKWKDRELRRHFDLSRCLEVYKWLRRNGIKPIDSFKTNRVLRSHPVNGEYYCVIVPHEVDDNGKITDEKTDFWIKKSEMDAVLEQCDKLDKSELQNK